MVRRKRIRARCHQLKARFHLWRTSCVSWSPLRRKSERATQTIYYSFADNPWMNPSCRRWRGFTRYIVNTTFRNVTICWTQRHACYRTSRGGLALSSQQRLKASGNGLHLLSITAWKRDFWIGPQMRLWGSISPWRMTDTMRNASSGSYAQQLGTLLRRLPSSIHSDSRQRNSIGPALCPRGS